MKQIIYYTKKRKGYASSFYELPFSLLHRLDGPAVIWPNGSKEYWINNKELNRKEVESWIKDNNINLKTKEHQALFMLKFG